MRYNPENFTFGFELEVGDVDRRLEIPPEFGTWEYSEADIINLSGEMFGVAADPLGMQPHWGGEINIVPAHTPAQLASRIQCLIRWFRQQGSTPTISHRAHSHVHVRVPGLRTDIKALKRLTWAIMEHQDDVMRHCHKFVDMPELSRASGARTYLKWDGARRMPRWMSENIYNKAENFDDFIRLQCCGKDGVSRGRPFRYGINTYCMKHIDTIEFRMFRGTLSSREMLDCICFAREFIAAAVNGDHIDVKDMIHEKGLTFPSMTFDLEAELGFERTCWPKERGKKRRTLIDI